MNGALLMSAQVVQNPNQHGRLYFSLITLLCQRAQATLASTINNRRISKIFGKEFCEEMIHDDH